MLKSTVTAQCGLEIRCLRLLDRLLSNRLDLCAVRVALQGGLVDLAEQADLFPELPG